MRMVSSQTSAAIQAVVVHGTTAADGHLIEAEILTSTDASLNQRSGENSPRRVVGIRPL